MLRMDSTSSFQDLWECTGDRRKSTAWAPIPLSACGLSSMTGLVSTTAKTVEESRLLFVSRDDFYEVLSDHVDIVEGLFKHLVQRLRRLASVVEQ